MKSLKRQDLSLAGALLFDLDGTIVDSMPSHNRAWQKTLSDLGVSISEEELYRLAGIPNLVTAQMFVDRYNLNVSAEDLVTTKELLFENSMELLQPVEAVAEIIRTYDGKLPMAVVSGSTRSRIIESLAAVGLSSMFKAVVSCEDTERGKPFPDPYLKAATLLEIAPQRCVVFEDGDAGIQSAESALMRVVKVSSGQLLFAP